MTYFNKFAYCLKFLIVITKHCPNFTNLNFSPHFPPPPNLIIYQSSTRTHCVLKIPVQNQAVPTCSLCGPIFHANSLATIAQFVHYMIFYRDVHLHLRAPTCQRSWTTLYYLKLAKLLKPPI